MEYTRTGSIEGDCTNNIAEYTALIEGLKECSSRGFDTVEVFGDSQLVIRQMKGEYKVKNAKLKPLHNDAMVLVRSFFGVTFTWIPREENTIADGLSHASPSPRGYQALTDIGESSYRTMWNTMKDEIVERVDDENRVGRHTLRPCEDTLARMNEIENAITKKKKDE